MSAQSLRHGPPANKRILAAVVLVMSVLDVADSEPTYQWKDPTTGEAVTCEKCPPGTCVTSHCTRHRRTECQSCPDLHYTELWNYADKCRYCNVFCSEREVEVQSCNATHNRQCQCQPGFYLNFDFCVEHSKCPPGFGVQTLGTAYSDTQCQKCLPGTFSNASSRTEPCQPHRDCRAEGLEVNAEGDQHHDTLCTSCQGYDASGTQGGVECEQAIFDFMASRISPKTLKQLLRGMESTRQRPRKQLNKKGLRKLRILLKKESDSNPGQNLVDTLLQLLDQAHLHKLQKDIRRKFKLGQ